MLVNESTDLILEIDIVDFFHFSKMNPNIKLLLKLQEQTTLPDIDDRIYLYYNRRIFGNLNPRGGDACPYGPGCPGYVIQSILVGDLNLSVAGNKCLCPSIHRVDVPPTDSYIRRLRQYVYSRMMLIAFEMSNNRNIVFNLNDADLVTALRSDIRALFDSVFTHGVTNTPDGMRGLYTPNTSNLTSRLVSHGLNEALAQRLSQNLGVRVETAKAMLSENFDPRRVEIMDPEKWKNLPNTSNNETRANDTNDTEVYKPLIALIGILKGIILDRVTDLQSANPGDTYANAETNAQSFYNIIKANAQRKQILLVMLNQMISNGYIVANNPEYARNINRVIDAIKCVNDEDSMKELIVNLSNDLRSILPQMSGISLNSLNGTFVVKSNDLLIKFPTLKSALLPAEIEKLMMDEKTRNYIHVNLYKTNFDMFRVYLNQLIKWRHSTGKKKNEYVLEDLVKSINDCRLTDANAINEYFKNNDYDVVYDGLNHDVLLYYKKCRLRTESLKYEQPVPVVYSRASKWFWSTMHKVFDVKDGEIVVNGDYDLKEGGHLELYKFAHSLGRTISPNESHVLPIYNMTPILLAGYIYNDEPSNDEVETVKPLWTILFNEVNKTLFEMQ